MKISDIFDIISGTSAGAIIGAMISLKYSPFEIMYKAIN